MHWVDLHIALRGRAASRRIDLGLKEDVVATTLDEVAESVLQAAWTRDKIEREEKGLPPFSIQDIDKLLPK